MSAPAEEEEDRDIPLPTPISEVVRGIAESLIADCRLAGDYEAELLCVADELEELERRGVLTEQHIMQVRQDREDAAYLRRLREVTPHGA